MSEMPKISPEIVQETLDLTCTIQAIPAPTFQEQPRAEYFLNELRALGLADVQLDGVGNVLGRIPANVEGNPTRPLVVSAHMDTVHPLGTPLEIRRTPDRIIGPGIGDNALGTAALLALARLLLADGGRRVSDVWLAFNVGEEGLGDLRGIQAVVDRFEAAPLAYLVVEGMGLGTILHRGLGVERYKVTVQTPGGHSWVDYGAPSAIHELCGIVTKLSALRLPHLPCTTLNVGVIQGGTSINTIAANAWFELDLRSEDGHVLAELVYNAQAIARSAERSGVRVQIERIGKRLAGGISENHPLVNLGRNVLTTLGLEARVDIASTDSNYPLSRGYPSICVGITNGNNAHTLEEYILTEPTGKGLMQLYMLVTRLWEEKINVFSEN